MKPKDGTKSKKKKLRFSNAVVLLFLLVGVGVMLFPTASDAWYRFKATREIAQYNAVAAGSGVDYSELWEAAEEYNCRLAETGSFTVSATTDMQAEVAELLNPLGTGMMGYIDIPAINVHIPIYQGTDEAALQAGAGYWIGTSLPTGGESTHCVLTAHNGLTKAKMFTDIDQLEIGDTFTLTILDRVLTYEVDQILVVEPDDFTELNIVEGEDYVTLYTCTPYGVNTHRLLVRGTRVETTEDGTSEEGLQEGSWWLLPLVVLAIFLILVIVFRLILSGQRKKKTEAKNICLPCLKEMTRMVDRKKRWGRLAGIMFLLIFMVGVRILPANAAETASLTLSYDQDGAGFRIYRVAVYTGKYELTGSFAGYSVDLSSGEWTDLAATLAAFAEMDNIEPDLTGVIQSGSVRFDGLEKGLYLVLGDSTSDGEYRYTPSAFLIYVADEDVISIVKFEMSPEEPRTTGIVVMKVWDGDTETVRPASVTIRLLCDGEIYDTQVLDEENDWTFIWNGLDASANWQITEIDVADNYTVLVSQDGYTFTVINTYQDETPTETTEAPSETTTEIPTDTTTEIPAETTTKPSTETTFEAPSDTPEETTTPGTKLPQTGQLWWPVLFLAVLGVALVAAGLTQTKKKKNGEKEA